MYVCRSTSLWDDVYTLLLRWVGSQDHGRENKIYCLAGIEFLSFEMQRKAAAIIQENSSKSANPLLIISGNADKQHLVAQLAHLKASVVPLPLAVLRQVSGEISGKYSKGITSHTSLQAGAGKTFNIRYNASKTSSVCVAVSVTSDSNVLNSIWSALQAQNIEAEKDYYVLHLDIYDTAGASLDSFLFDLVFLGGVQDSFTGQQFFWDSAFVGIALEVPSSGESANSFRVCELLPQQEAVVSKDTFAVSSKVLRAGMGFAEYQTARNDGTSIATNTSTSEEISAHMRLLYVCTGLDIMDSNQGRFPFVFEGPQASPLESLRLSQKQEFIRQSSSDKLSASRCLELLCDALNVQKPSLWCIWNFVNVFYWQLRDMHFPDSPINCACMPDSTADRKGDTETKAKFKGEVIQFLIRTARELATRQVKEKDDSGQIAAVFCTGMSAYQFNGLWTRMEMEYDGKPVFRKKCINCKRKALSLLQKGEKHLGNG